MSISRRGILGALASAPITGRALAQQAMGVRAQSGMARVGRISDWAEEPMPESDGLEHIREAVRSAKVKKRSISEAMRFGWGVHGVQEKRSWSPAFKRHVEAEMLADQMERDDRSSVWDMDKDALIAAAIKLGVKL